MTDDQKTHIKGSIALLVIVGIPLLFVLPIVSACLLLGAVIGFPKK